MTVSDSGSDSGRAPLDPIVAAIQETLEASHRAREVALGTARRAMQASARSIRALHRQEFEAAAVLIDEARAAAEDAQATLAPYPDLYHAGFLHDAVKVYERQRGLHGLAEVAGEPLHVRCVRRYGHPPQHDHSSAS